MRPDEHGTNGAERHGYRASAGNRWAGLGGTLTIYALVLAGVLATVTHGVSVTQPSTLTAVDLRPQASPPETPPEEKEAPEPVRERQPTEPAEVQPIERAILSVVPIPAPRPTTAPRPADTGPVEPETAAPRTAPAALAPKASNNAPDTWEGRVLAQLHKHLRYPRSAMARRKQGVPYIRFVMDRDGKVLSSRLERSSGFPDLDREAVALPRRASPLPSLPADRSGETLELVVPIEFFLR